MSLENVEKFLNLVKSNENLQKELILINEKLQKEEGKEEKIIADNVVPLAKKNGIIFTANDFLQYANEQMSALSEEDLLNVSGGISARNTAAALLVTFLGSLGVGATVNLLNLSQEDNKSVVRKAEKNNGEDSRNNQDEVNSAAQNAADEMSRTDQKTDVSEENNNENEPQIGLNVDQSANEASKTNEAEQKNRRDVMQNKNVVLPNSNAKNVPAAPQINVAPPQINAAKPVIKNNVAPPQANTAKTLAKNNSPTVAPGAVEPAEHAEHVGGYGSAVTGSEKNTVKPAARQEERVSFAPGVVRKTTTKEKEKEKLKKKAKKDAAVKPASKTIDKTAAKTKQDEGAKPIAKATNEDTSKKAISQPEESKESVKVVASGKCGVNAKWSCDSAGTLTISGTGPLQEYGYKEEPFPDEIKYSVKRIVIEDGITSLKNFFVFPHVVSMNIPASLTEQSADYFKACHQLESINVDENNTEYKSIDGVLFSKNGTKLLCYPGGKTDPSYTIPAGVNSIDKGAFFVSHLNNLIIPSSVSEIGENAFNSSRIKSIVYLGNNEPNFGEHAFTDKNNSTTIFVSNDYNGETFGGIAVTKVEDINAKSAEFSNTGAVGAAEHVEHVGGGITDYSSWHVWNRTVTSQAEHLVNFLRSLPRTPNGLPDLRYVSEATRAQLEADIIHVGSQIRTEKDGITLYLSGKNFIEDWDTVSQPNLRMLRDLYNHFTASSTNNVVAEVKPDTELEAFKQIGLKSGNQKYERFDFESGAYFNDELAEHILNNLDNFENIDAEGQRGLMLDTIALFESVEDKHDEIYKIGLLFDDSEISEEGRQKLKDFYFNTVEPNYENIVKPTNDYEKLRELDNKVLELGDLLKALSPYMHRFESLDPRSKDLLLHYIDDLCYKFYDEDTKKFEVEVTKGDPQEIIGIVGELLKIADNNIFNQGEVKEFGNQKFSWSDWGKAILATGAFAVTIAVGEVVIHFPTYRDVWRQATSPDAKNKVNDIEQKKVYDPRQEITSEDKAFVEHEAKLGAPLREAKIKATSFATKAKNRSTSFATKAVNKVTSSATEIAKKAKSYYENMKNKPFVEVTPETTASKVKKDLSSYGKELKSSGEKVGNAVKNVIDEGRTSVKDWWNGEPTGDTTDLYYNFEELNAGPNATTPANVQHLDPLGKTPAKNSNGGSWFKGFFGGSNSQTNAKPADNPAVNQVNVGTASTNSTPTVTPAPNPAPVPPAFGENNANTSTGWFSSKWSDFKNIFKRGGAANKEFKSYSPQTQENLNRANAETTTQPGKVTSTEVAVFNAGTPKAGASKSTKVAAFNAGSSNAGVTKSTAEALPNSASYKSKGDSKGSSLKIDQNYYNSAETEAPKSVGLVDPNGKPAVAHPIKEKQPTSTPDVNRKLTGDEIGVVFLRDNGKIAENSKSNAVEEYIKRQILDSKLRDPRPYSIKNNAQGENIPGDEAITKDSNISRLNIEKPFEGKFYKAPSDKAPGPGEGAMQSLNTSESSEIMKSSTFDVKAGSGDNGAMQIDNAATNLGKVPGTSLNTGGMGAGSGPVKITHIDFPNTETKLQDTGNPIVDNSLLPSLTKSMDERTIEAIKSHGKIAENSKSNAVEEYIKRQILDSKLRDPRPYSIKINDRMPDNEKIKKDSNIPPGPGKGAIQLPTASKNSPTVNRAIEKTIDTSKLPLEDFKGTTKIDSTNSTSGSARYMNLKVEPNNINYGPITQEEFNKLNAETTPQPGKATSTAVVDPAGIVDALNSFSDRKETKINMSSDSTGYVYRENPNKPVEGRSVNEAAYAQERTSGKNWASTPETSEVQTGSETISVTTLPRENINDVTVTNPSKLPGVKIKSSKFNHNNPSNKAPGPGKGAIQLPNASKSSGIMKPSSFNRNAADEKNKAVPVAKNENFFKRLYNSSGAKNDAASSFMPVENNNVENSNNTTLLNVNVGKGPANRFEKDLMKFGENLKVPGTNSTGVENATNFEKDLMEFWKSPKAPGANSTEVENATSTLHNGEPPKAQPGSTSTPLAQGSSEGEGAGTTWKDYIPQGVKDVYNSLPSKEQIKDGVGNAVNKGASAAKSAYDSAKPAVKDLRKLTSKEGAKEYASKHPNVAKVAKGTYMVAGAAAAGAIAGRVLSKDYGAPVKKAAAPAEEAAAEVLCEGNCGNNVNFKLDAEGTLTISGKGPMSDYSIHETAPWKYLNDKIENVVIEEGVTSIGDDAFFGCERLTSVVISDSVTAIGSFAFDGCASLTSVVIAANVIEIGEYAFSGCKSLTSVEIPASVTTIKVCAFMNCSKLTSVKFRGVPGSVSENVFERCGQLEEVEMPAEFDGNEFCGKSVKEEVAPASSSESAPVPDVEGEKEENANNDEVFDINSADMTDEENVNDNNSDTVIPEILGQNIMAFAKAELDKQKEEQETAAAPVAAQPVNGGERRVPPQKKTTPKKPRKI